MSPFTGPIPSAVYRRVSTDHQENSLIVQEAANDEYARRFGFTPTKDIEFADEDVSGSVPMMDRAGGRALLNRLAHGDIKHLVTCKQDRLGRDTIDSIRTVRRLWELGITPHFTTEGGAFPRTPQNELLFEIKASVAQYERNLIRDRVRLTAAHKFQRFELTGKVPFGYDVSYEFADRYQHVSPRALCWGSKDTPPESEAQLLIHAHGKPTGKPLIDNLAEQHWIRRMADLRKSMSLKAVADVLNAAGVTTKLGRPWQCGSVDGVLTSRHTARLLQEGAEKAESVAA